MGEFGPCNPLAWNRHRYFAFCGLVFVLLLLAPHEGGYGGDYGKARVEVEREMNRIHEGRGDGSREPSG